MYTWQENDAEMIVAKILAINKVAASKGRQKDAHAM